MLLVFLSFEGFPSDKNIVSMCVDVMNVFYCTIDLFMFICKILKFMLMLKIQH